MSTSTSYERLVPQDAASERSTFERQTSDYGMQPLESADIPMVEFRRHEGTHQERPRRSFPSMLVWWWPELVSSLFSIATFVSIVVVLQTYNGKPLTALHLPRYLTLNGILGALGTLNRAFMVAPVGSAIMQEVWLLFSADGQKTTLHDLDLYDAASRGAFGSFALIFQLRSRRLLACLGALITILSLAFSAFMQQVVTYDRMVAADPGSPLAPGNLARVETYTEFRGNPAEGGAQASSPPYDFVAAFYSGVLSGGIAPLTAPCPSSNCTWPLTPSLAVCGGCQVSPTPPPPVCFAACETDFYMGVTSTPNCTKIPDLYCNYTLPSGAVATLLNWDNHTDAEMTGSFPGFQAVGSTGAYYNFSAGDRLYAANFDLFGAPYDSYSGRNLTFTHTECALWFCVETYNTTVIENRQIQQVVSTIGKLNASSYVFPPVGAAADPQNSTNFNLTGNVAFEVIGMWTSAVMTGSVGLNLESQSFSSDLMKGVWNGTTDPDAWINNIATSLTNVVRSTNSTPRAEYGGTAYQLGVSVRWVWLSLPAALVVMAIAFLFTIMAKTALSPVAPWKGSPMTLLLFDIDHKAKEASYGQAHKYRGLQSAVGNMKVGLSEEPGKTWRFRAS